MTEDAPEITLYNTAKRTKERFHPLDPANVRMYVCGPTVYDRAHIGNARPVVVFDVLFRLLRHVYGEGHVTYVRNVTDVDDKINARAAAEKRPIRELTNETLAAYQADMDALGALRPTQEPRATDYIPQMVAMIETLIARGNAYAAEGHVLFSVASFPAYGRFANRSLDEMQAGARVEVAPYKRDPMDFVLWKPSSSAEPGWPSPWGHGRPGWHIECSAMSAALLGESFDIHGGGIDLVFPHHENEIAQSRCAHPESEFARYWLHNGFLNVEGEKMSKSLGNFFTVRDLLDKRIPGEVIRFVLLSTHYRQPMDFTEAKVQEAFSVLEDWERLLDDQSLEDAFRYPVPAQVLGALADDLNTPTALTAAKALYSYDTIASGRLVGGGPNSLTKSLILLGFETIVDGSWRKISEAEKRIIEDYLGKRAAARQARDFAAADRMRSDLLAAGIAVMDRRDGGRPWQLKKDFDPERLRALA